MSGRHNPQAYTSSGRHHPWANTPQADTPPWVDTPQVDTPGQTPPGRHIPQQTPPLGRPTGQTPPSAATAADGKHPTGMLSCLAIFLIQNCLFIVRIEKGAPVKI